MLSFEPEFGHAGEPGAGRALVQGVRHEFAGQRHRERAGQRGGARSRRRGIGASRVAVGRRCCAAWLSPTELTPQALLLAGNRFVEVQQHPGDAQPRGGFAGARPLFLEEIEQALLFVR